MPDNPPAAITPETMLESVRATVQTIPEASQATQPTDSIIMYIASVADSLPPWGTQTQRRDKMLREFFIREPFLAGAVGSVCASHASYRWEIESEDDELKKVVTAMLETAHFGEGWTSFASMVTIDYLTQDRGAYVEIIRDGASPSAPVLGIAVLEALRCTPTGNPRTPVVYEDEHGGRHLLNYYDVARLIEMPSSISTMRGMQYSAVSRVLAASQIMRDIIIYRGEKVGGRFQRVLHIVGGPAKQDIRRALQMGDEDADNQGLARFQLPTILASLDPSKPVSHVEIPLASLPDNFDLEDEMKWYITTIAACFGRGYQDFAPLPGGNLGSSGQCEVMAAKTKGKGPRLFMSSVEYAMNFRGIVPTPLAKFNFREMDLEDEGNHEKIRRLRAETRESMIKSGEIKPEVARLMAIKDGDYDKDLLPVIEKSEEEARVRAEENLRLNAEVNAETRQTPGGRTSQANVPKPTRSIGAAKKDMLAPDFRADLQAMLPLAAIVHSLRTNQRSEALAPVLEKMLAGQVGTSQAVTGLLVEVGALIKTLKEAPPPQVIIQPPIIPPAKEK